MITYSVILLTWIVAKRGGSWDGAGAAWFFGACCDVVIVIAICAAFSK